MRVKLVVECQKENTKDGKIMLDMPYQQLLVEQLEVSLMLVYLVLCMVLELQQQVLERGQQVEL